MGAVRGCPHGGWQAGAAQRGQELTGPRTPGPWQRGAQGLRRACWTLSSTLSPAVSGSSRPLQVARALGSLSSGHWWVASGYFVPESRGAGTQQDPRRAEALPAFRLVLQARGLRSAGLGLYPRGSCHRVDSRVLWAAGQTRTSLGLVACSF